MPSLLGMSGLILVLAAGPAPLPADNSLTSDEVSAGWIKLFDGESTFGWKPRGDAQWKVVDGVLESKDGSSGFLCTTTEFANFELRGEVWVDSAMNSGFFLRAPVDGEISLDNTYEVNVYDAHPQWPSGSINTVARAKARAKTVGRWASYRVVADGDHLQVWVDEQLTADAYAAKSARGVIGLQRNGAGVVRFRNLKLLPLGAASLFNGRDLKGWTVQPGHPSVFTVTTDGWMNVKNGNGNIESSAQFGDFCLQMEIISNGKNLNSGVFFRNQPGGFWLGYEAQIRNQWQGEDRAKPVDYGTGGIYNRQPARRVVSSDHEWFTMTVIAHGLHFATWVNGIQVADFTDTRPPNEANARQGSRRSTGSLSIQGHDPTTDLSFRNIRAVEYPVKR